MEDKYFSMHPIVHACIIVCCCCNIQPCKPNDIVLIEPASTKLGYFSKFRIKNAKLSYKGTKHVAIYAFSLGEFLDVRKYAGVKDLTNVMSGPVWPKAAKDSVTARVQREDPSLINYLQIKE